MKRFVLVSGILLAVTAVNARAAVIYDFENPPYTLGNVVGQAGWVSAVAGTSANVVNAGTPPFGSQYVSVAGDGVNFGSEGLVTNTLAGSGFGNVTKLSLQMAFANIGQSYAEISLYDSANVAYAQLGFDPGSYYTYTNNALYAPTAATVAPNTVYDVDVTLNFLTQMYKVTFSTNSLITYNSGLVTLQATTTAAQAGNGNILLRGGYYNSSFNGVGYFDNIAVVAVVPEPATFGLVGIGILLLWRVRRRSF